MRLSFSALALIISTCVMPGGATAKTFSILGGIDGTMTQSAGGSAPEERGMALGPTRIEIDFVTALPAGSILVRARERKLYFILPAGRAIAYTVAVGREGYSWHGSNQVSRKAEWPDWRPPPEMLAREAESGHIIPTLVKGGPHNPLGARALYIGDTAYRIHGTDKPWSIGQASSSGCIRMLNEDVTELYDRVKLGAKVVVE